MPQQLANMEKKIFYVYQGFEIIYYHEMWIRKVQPSFMMSIHI